MDDRNDVRNPSDWRRRDVVLGGLRLAALTPFLGAVLPGCGGGSQETDAPATSGGKPEGGGAGTGATPGGGSGASRPNQQSADQQLATEIDANEQLLQSLQYTNESPKPDQSCANCLFYTQRKEGLGKCQLIPQGVVKSSGWCASWQKQSA